MGQLLLGVDIGTYSSKGVLVDPDGTLLKSCIVEHSMDTHQPGWAEQDAETVWWSDLVKICQNLLNNSPYSGADVAGVAVSAIGPCMLPLNDAGEPLRPGILYGVDTRASAEIALLNETLGEEAIFEFSRMTLSSQAVGPKILWMKRNEPELWRQINHITTATGYLVFKLTGEKIIDFHTASHFMPLLDPKKLAWSTQLEEIVDISKLPNLGWSNEVAGHINKTASAITGLTVGTPVAIGTIDALSEAISVGVIEDGDLMIMYGSTTFFILIQEAPTPDKRMWTVSGAFQGQYNLAAGMATTGSLTRWFRDELACDLAREAAYEILFSEAETINPGAGGLLMLPYFSGERTPINDPKARGTVIGLTLSHKRGHLYRAVLESVAYGIRHNLETFNAIGANVKRIVSVGGGTQSPIWLQIVSDVAGIEQIVPAVTIGASYGDAFLAGLAAGILERADLATWVQTGVSISPNQARQAVYERLYVNYLQLYEQTREIAHYLAEFSTIA